MGGMQLGGSLMDTLTVPMFDICGVELPPLQLMMINGTASNATPSRHGTGRFFIRRSTIDITTASHFDIEFLIASDAMRGQNVFGRRQEYKRKL